MTCIAAFIDIKTNTIYMGGDSAASNENFIKINKDPKVFIHEDYIIGSSGSLVLIQLLKSKFKPPSFKKSKLTDMPEFMATEFFDNLKETLLEYGNIKQEEGIDSIGECTILVGHHGRLFYIDNDLSITECNDNYCSIGSGAGFAWASLFTSIKCNKKLSPKGRVRLALESAAKYSPSVSGPFIILSK